MRQQVTIQETKIYGGIPGHNVRTEYDVIGETGYIIERGMKTREDAEKYAMAHGFLILEG